MKKMNQKILSLLTAGVMLASTAFGMIPSAAGENVVKFGTPVLDGVKDAAYEGSYSISLKELHYMGLLSDMNKFQFMEAVFSDVYYDESGDPSGYIKIFDKNGAEITAETFMDEYDDDYAYLPDDVTFRWTDAGVESEFFANADFSFLWDENSIHMYVEVTDNEDVSLSDQDVANNFSSPWGSAPWLIDCVIPSFVIKNRPVVGYKWDKDGTTFNNNVVIDENECADFTKISVTALSQANVYFDGQSDALSYYDTENLTAYIEPLTYLNMFHINWWERAAYVDGEGPGRYYRELACDGSDTTYNEAGEPSTCADSQDVFVSRHVFTPERIAERDAARAANLDYIAGGLTETGYVLEMSVPFTGDVWNSIRENGYTIDFNPEVVDACNPAVPIGGPLAGGEAKKWYYVLGKEDVTLTLETPECDGNHKYHDGVVTVEPTCLDGEKILVCALCDATTTETIAPAYDHKLVDAPATDATCTEPAYTAGTVCEECGTYMSGHEAQGEALGHNSVDAPATDATCTEPAYTAGTQCDRCGEYTSGHEAVGEALGHTDAEKDTICDVCGENARMAGDVNYDSRIDTKDLTRLMKDLSGQEVVSYGSDVNGDEKVDPKDLTRLMKAIAGEDVELF